MMNTSTISTLLCSFAALAFSIVISSKSLNDKRYRWFAILCILIAVWNLLFFFSRIFYSLIFDRIYTLFTLILGPVSFYFFTQFIESPEKHATLIQPKFKYILGIAVILALGILLPYDLLYGFRTSSNLFSLFLVGLAFAILIQETRTIKLGRLAHRKKLFFIGAGLLTVLALISDGLSEIGWSVPAIGKVFLILYLYFIYQTITKEKVLDLEDLTAKGVMFFVLAAILTFIYAILVSWVEGPSLFIFNTFVASFVILILFEPVRSLIERTTYDFFLKGRRRREEKLETLKEDALETTDIRDLTQLVVVGLKDSLGATQAHFFLLDPEGIKYKLIRSLEPDPSQIKVTEIPITHDFIKHLERTYPRPANTYSLNREMVERGRSAPKERLQNALQMFDNLNAHIACAFIEDSKLLGFCSFINEKSERPFSLSDLELLIPFSKQIALAIKNLEIYDQIRQRDRLATVGEMAAGLAHEIRNPLGAIKGAAQYLEPTADNNPQNEFLKVIIDEVNRLNKVVTQFLNYAKPLEHQPTETNLSDLLLKTIQAVIADQPQNIKIVTDIETNPLFAMVDANQVKQVFLNLILNACQSMSEGGTIRFSLRKLKNDVQIIVEDTGIGIPPEDLKKLFIPFYTTREGGSGLGLPICQKIIRTHGGTIKVESELRKGSKFIITLPQAS